MKSNFLEIYLNFKTKFKHERENLIVNFLVNDSC